LLDEGFFNEALELDDLISKAIKDEGFDNKGKPLPKSKTPTMSLSDLIEGKSSSTSTGDIGASKTSELDKLLKHCKGKRKNSLLTRKNGQAPSSLLTSHERSIRREIIKEFLSTCTKQRACSNCNGHSPKFRHDSHNKIFCAQMAERNRLLNLSNKKKLQPALEFLSLEKKKRRVGSALLVDDDEEDEKWDSSDSDDEEDDDMDVADIVEDGLTDRLTDGNKASKTKEGDKYMHALEVEAQVKLAWRTTGAKLCCHIFGMPDVDSADYETGYQMFFLRALTVPPNRFRPAMHLGTVTAENPQNSFLANVLIQNRQLEQNLDIIRNNGEDDGEEAALAEDSAKGGVARKKVAKVSKGEAYRRLFANWIEMQTVVNTFFDSDKDPKGFTADKSPGIKQLLEKKEGLFRRYVL
jgi:DNA-directed RNA polymerase I subunit RPA1